MRGGRLEQLLLRARRLHGGTTLLELGFALVESVRSILGVERAGLYLLSKSGHWLCGLVGTNAYGQLVDERNLRHAVDPSDEQLWRDLATGKRSYELIDDAPLIAHDGERSSVLRYGWLAKTPIVSGDRPIGYLYNDSALSGAPCRRDTQEYIATFLALTAATLQVVRERSHPPDRAGCSATTHACLEQLETFPGASNQELAKRLRTTANALARHFKHEVGTSLLDYRNELRLKRFFDAVEAAEHSSQPLVLVDLALEAGFGSYSQFHRIFSRRYGQSPQRYLQLIAPKC